MNKRKTYFADIQSAQACNIDITIGFVIIPEEDSVSEQWMEPEQNFDEDGITLIDNRYWIWTLVEHADIVAANNGVFE